MTILVDAAIWPWRGDKWAHLVSDDSYQELHDFATSIGKKRVSFQGDHYDVHRADRAAAIDAGAVEVDSRDLVRALRAAGLRRRPADPVIDWSWQVRTTLDSPDEVAEALSPVHTHPDGERFGTLTVDVARAAGLGAGPVEVVALRGSFDLAIVLSAPTPAWRRRPVVAGLDVAEAYVSTSDTHTSFELLSGPGVAR